MAAITQPGLLSGPCFMPATNWEKNYQESRAVAKRPRDDAIINRYNPITQLWQQVSVDCTEDLRE